MVNCLIVCQKRKFHTLLRQMYPNVDFGRRPGYSYVNSVNDDVRVYRATESILKESVFGVENFCTVYLDYKIEEKLLKRIRKYCTAGNCRDLGPYKLFSFSAKWLPKIESGK